MELHADVVEPCVLLRRVYVCHLIREKSKASVRSSDRCQSLNEYFTCYNHIDSRTIAMLFERTRAAQRQYFTPLGNEQCFEPWTSTYARFVLRPTYGDTQDMLQVAPSISRVEAIRSEKDSRAKVYFASDASKMEEIRSRKSRCEEIKERIRAGFDSHRLVHGHFVCAPLDRVRFFEDVRTRKAVVCIGGRGSEDYGAM